MSHFNDDLKKVEGFFLTLLSGRLNEEERRQAGFAFFGVQGPWYTVGWKMSVLIEKTYGRTKLIECICDQRKLLPTYNEAAAKHNRKSREPLALWSASVINRIAAAPTLGSQRHHPPVVCAPTVPSAPRTSWCNHR